MASLCTLRWNEFWKGIYSKAQGKVPHIHGLIKENGENVSERKVKWLLFRYAFLTITCYFSKILGTFAVVSCLFISKRLKSSFIKTERHHNHELSLNWLKYMTVSLHFETWTHCQNRITSLKIYMPKRIFWIQLYILRVFY